MFLVLSTLTVSYTLCVCSPLYCVSHVRYTIWYSQLTVWYSSAPNIGSLLFLWTQFITDSKHSWRHSQRQNSHFCPLGRISGSTAKDLHLQFEYIYKIRPALFFPPIVTLLHFSLISLSIVIASQRLKSLYSTLYIEPTLHQYQIMICLQRSL